MDVVAEVVIVMDVIEDVAVPPAMGPSLSISPEKK